MALYDWLDTAFFLPQTEEYAGENAANHRLPLPQRAVFTAFDLETTGLNREKDKIVEIGAIAFDCLGVIARFNSLVNPGIPMPAAASAINGITDDMLADKPDIATVLQDFLRFIGSSTLVAHNATFDLSFVNSNLAALYEHSMLEEWQPPFPKLPNRIVDTQSLAKERFPNRPNYKLQNLASWLDITAINAHRAEDDARLCMELFRCCLKK